MIALAQTLELRRVSDQPSDTCVIYAVPVAGREREINREEWSRVVLELLEAEAGGNRTRLAELIGVDYQTIRRWIIGKNAVSEESVRQVARAFKLSAIDLLVRVGYYQPGELISAPEPVDAADDDLLTEIDAAKVPPSVKRELRQYVEDQRVAFEKQLAENVRWRLAAEQRNRRTA